MRDNGIICQLADLDDSELAEVVAKAQAIRMARKNARKEEDWHKVVNAICEYQDKYGDIYIEDKNGFVWITNKCDFSTFGEIYLPGVRN
jgi:hypothetical protein